MLEGQVSFGRLGTDGKQELLPCTVGESVTIPANAPHAFYNQTDKPVRFLSTSVYYHEAIFNEVAIEVGPDDPMPTELDMAEMTRFAEVAARYQGYNVELEADKQ